MTVPSPGDRQAKWCSSPVWGGGGLRWERKTSSSLCACKVMAEDPGGINRIHLSKLVLWSITDHDVSPTFRRHKQVKSARVPGNKYRLQGTGTYREAPGRKGGPRFVWNINESLNEGETKMIHFLSYYHKCGRRGFQKDSEAWLLADGVVPLISPSAGLTWPHRNRFFSTASVQINIGNV